MGFKSKTGSRAAILTAAFAACGLPGAANAQVFLSPVDFRAAPIDASDPLVGIPIPGATAAEYRANLLWNLRAGLNVAALQCQFSPFLRVAPNYNAMLAQHSGELATAYTVINAYFKRVGGAKGQKMFDDYSTMTYNGFSTLQAQMGFCQTASNIMKSALATPKGEFTAFALRRMRELRNSLVPAYDMVIVYNPYAIRTIGIPSLSEDCWDKTDRPKPACAVSSAEVPAAAGSARL